MSLAEDLGGRTFSCILADPPWGFRAWSGKQLLATNPRRGSRGGDAHKTTAEQHYATMTMAEITALDVEAISNPDACLFLWVVDCMLPDALDIATQWGYRFKTVAFTWAKQSKTGRAWHMSCGYWTRGGSEQCLLFTRGKPHPQSHSVRQLVVAPRREHSRKPDEVRQGIERLTVGPRLELFAREAVPGWTSWGDEAGKWTARRPSATIITPDSDLTLAA